MPLDFKAVAAKWQEKWRNGKAFEADVDPGKKKFFVCVPYPYVNGAPHVGHSYSYFRTDACARFKRMKGFNVLFPQGFHATGEPILGAVERLRNGDAKQIEGFRQSGATDGDLERFKRGPEEVARFWMARWIADLQSAGMSIDWRRQFVTTDLTPTYSRFVEWQYNTLRKRGYVAQGTHPVIYCPHDRSPTGDHDRLEGEGESPVEYALIKFYLEADGERLVLPCATLRPETAYGVTNLWLNPEAEYVRLKVAGETWVVAKEAVIKLQDQQKQAEVLGKVEAKGLIGKTAVNPVTDANIPILPAEFVSPGNASGVVMGVPAHAPYDYVALEDLKRDAEAQKLYGLNAKELLAVRPVGLITLRGYGEFPAAAECRKMGIKSQKDEGKLEKATSEVYRKEFHEGVLNGRCGGFAGLKVSECKQALLQEFAEKGFADVMWECSGKVVCRCGTACHVKILENQWFLRFGDRKWKDEVQAHIKGMQVLPEEARLQMENTVEWLQNKACTRRSGLGTKLPWDNEWIVETLSDSTIYMAYYTISGIIRERDVKSENLPDAAFDFIFLGIGDENEAASDARLDVQALRDMRAEFEYFYPVDLRNSGKDLLQNHLLFFVFHHSAIFRREHWPRGISVNGYVTVEGEKMSKSRGNFIPFSALVGEHGADLVRLNIIAAGENMDDADWKAEGVRTYQRLLDFVYDTGRKAAAAAAVKAPPGREERLLESRLNSAIRNAEAAYEQMRFRTACQAALFDPCGALKAYMQAAAGREDWALVKAAVQKIALMVSPMAPHVSEEIWEALGNTGFASLARFPVADESKIDPALEQEEKAVAMLSADIQKILEVAKIARPVRVRVYTAPKWKAELLAFASEEARRKGSFDFGGVLKAANADSRFRQHAKDLPPLLKALERQVNFFKENPMPRGDEFLLLEQAKAALAAAFGCSVEVIRAEEATRENDPQGKAGRALPFKPAILVQ
ncbi:MAG: leucine--tRNA ligase [Candidatus Micrarchaeota archaeon]